MADGWLIIAFSPAGPQWAMQLDIDLKITWCLLDLHHRVAALIALRLLSLFSQGNWLVHLLKTSSSLLNLIYHSLLTLHRLTHQSMCQFGFLLHLRQLLHTHFVAQHSLHWRYRSLLSTINFQTLDQIIMYFIFFSLLLQQLLSNKLFLQWNFKIWRSNMPQWQSLCRQCSLMYDHSIRNPFTWINICL